MSLTSRLLYDAYECKAKVGWNVDMEFKGLSLGFHFLIGISVVCTTSCHCRFSMQDLVPPDDITFDTPRPANDDLFTRYAVASHGPEQFLNA